MSDEKQARAQLALQVEADAVLSDFVRPLPKFLGTGKYAIATSFNNIAKRVGKMRGMSGIQFAIRDGRSGYSSYTQSNDGSNCYVGFLFSYSEIYMAQEGATVIDICNRDACAPIAVNGFVLLLRATALNDTQFVIPRRSTG